MTDIDPLLQRNNDFAATFPHEEASIVARHQVGVLTCLDPRSDPSAFLDLEVGDAMVVRNADGRVSAAVAPGAQEQLSPDLMKFWNAILPGQISEHPGPPPMRWTAT